MSLATVWVLFVFVSPVFAQQFQLVPGAIPGPAQQWTESVECADIDDDGEIDVFLGYGGGWSIASAVAYQHQVLIDQGGLTFREESRARFGVHATCAKRVVTGDVNGDGSADALFLNWMDGSPSSL